MITNQDLLEYSILESVFSPLIKSKKVLSIKEMDEVFESLITESKSKKLKTKLLNKGYAKHINTLTKKVTQDFVYDFYFLNHQPLFTSKKSATPEPVTESVTTQYPYSITFTYGKGGFICEEFGTIPEEVTDESDIAQLYRAIDEADIFDSDWTMEEDEPYGIKIYTKDGDITFTAEVETQPGNTYTISRTIDDYLNVRDGAAHYDKGAVDCSNIEELIQELAKWKDSVNKAIGNINVNRDIESINLNEETDDEKELRISQEDERYNNIPKDKLEKAAREISGNHSARSREQYAKLNEGNGSLKTGDATFINSAAELNEFISVQLNFKNETWFTDQKEGYQSNEIKKEFKDNRIKIFFYENSDATQGGKGIQIVFQPDNGMAEIQFQVFENGKPSTDKSDVFNINNPAERSKFIEYIKEWFKGESKEFAAESRIPKVDNKPRYKVTGSDEEQYLKEYNELVHNGKFSGSLEDYIQQEEANMNEDDDTFV